MKRPLMGAGIALVAGVAAAFLGVPWFGVCLGLAGLNIGIKIWAESSFKYVLGLSAFLIVGFCRTLPEVLDPADFSSSGPTIQGSVCRVQKKANSTWIYVRTREKEEVLVVAANDSEGEAEYYKGQIIEIWGEAEAFASPGNPGQFDEKSYYLSQGVSCRVWAEKIVLVSEGRWFWRQLRFLEVLKERMSVFYRESMSESGAGVVLAAVLGDRSGFILYCHGTLSQAQEIHCGHLAFYGVGPACDADLRLYDRLWRFYAAGHGNDDIFIDRQVIGKKKRYVDGSCSHGRRTAFIPSGSAFFSRFSAFLWRCGRHDFRKIS